MTEHEGMIPTVIVARGDMTNAVGGAGWSRCARCHHGVIVPAGSIAKVTVGTWRALCIVCAEQIAEDHPELFDPRNFDRRLE